jgi:hypothetical protein
LAPAGAVVELISEERIMGFVEGEGCFSITIQRVIERRQRTRNKPSNIKRPYLFRAHPTFRLTISEQDREILNVIRETLGFGQIYVQNRSQKDSRYKDIAYYYAQGLKECLLAKDFFQRQKFYTNKGRDFEFWCKALEIIKSGRHLEKDGLLEICGIRDQMNKRSSKGKWCKEEIEKILDAKPIHNPTYFNEKQVKLIHNKSFDLEGWLKPRPGNNMKGSVEPKAAQKPAEA